jgi:hypothetical protein
MLYRRKKGERVLGIESFKLVVEGVDSPLEAQGVSGEMRYIFPYMDAIYLKRYIICLLG